VLPLRDALIATEPMKAIARQAAIGAAVERLPLDTFVNIGSPIERGGEWRVATHGRVAYADTLPAALEEALRHE